MYVIFNDEDETCLSLFRSHGNRILEDEWQTKQHANSIGPLILEDCLTYSQKPTARHVVELLKKHYGEEGKFRIYKVKPKTVYFLD